MPNSSSMLNAAQLLAQAEQAYSAKNYPVAIDLYHRIIREHPQSIIAQTAQPRLAEAEKQHQLIVSEQERTERIRKMEQERAQEYEHIQALVNNPDLRSVVWMMWNTFTDKYPNYDPRSLVDNIYPPHPLTEVARQFTGKRNTDWKPIIVSLGEIVKGTPLPEIEMCLVPIGTFKMGAGSDAHPQTIDKPYWMARYPVTNAQWRVAVEAGVVKVPRDVEWYNDPKMADCPVVYVTWYQALAFAQWAGCTLPSELETEYAARGLDNLIYPWGNDWEDRKRAVWDKNSGGKPNPVTSKPEGVSWVGAMHLSGNVWEWQRSQYKVYPYNPNDGREGLFSSNTNSRVLRGGSWRDDATDYVRSSSRYFNTPGYTYFGYGFRCARS